MSRDMTNTQFLRAASDNGFAVSTIGLRDTKYVADGKRGITYGYSYNMPAGTINRRASLARAIQMRENDCAKPFSATT